MFGEDLNDWTTLIVEIYSGKNESYQDFLFVPRRFLNPPFSTLLLTWVCSEKATTLSRLQVLKGTKESNLHKKRNYNWPISLDFQTLLYHTKKWRLILHQSKGAQWKQTQLFRKRKVS